LTKFTKKCRKNKRPRLKQCKDKQDRKVPLNQVRQKSNLEWVYHQITQFKVVPRKANQICKNFLLHYTVAVLQVGKPQVEWHQQSLRHQHQHQQEFNTCHVRVKAESAKEHQVQRTVTVQT
jgi:hypothetical protein